MSVEFNMDDFVQSMHEMTDAMLKACEMGAGKAASALLSDTIMDMPAVPLDEGTLRGSGSAFVQNNLVDTAPNVGGSPNPASEGDESLPPDTVVAVVGFNTPYAAYQHEGERKDGTHVVTQEVAPRDANGNRTGPGYSHTGVGKKFLEKKLFDKEDEYVAIVAKEIKGAMRNA